MSDSVRPQRRQPTTLPHPWDSPGRNTGVGCHFLLQYMKVKSESKVPQSCPTLRDPMDCSLPGSSTHGIFQARVLEWGAIHCLLRSNSSIDKLFNRNSRKRSTWQLNMFKVLKALMFLILGKLSIRKEDSKIDIFKTKF